MHHSPAAMPMNDVKTKYISYLYLFQHEMFTPGTNGQFYTDYLISLLVSLCGSPGSDQMQTRPGLVVNILWELACLHLAMTLPEVKPFEF